MRYFYLFLAIGFLLLSCNQNQQSVTERQQKARLEGKVQFHQKSKPDSIYISLSSFAMEKVSRPNSRLGKPIEFKAISDSTFFLQVDPGRYTLSAFAFGFKPIRTGLYIADSLVNVSVKFDFYPVSLDPGKIEYVKLYGAFNEWNIMSGKKMTKLGKVWKIDPSAFLKSGDEYQIFPYRNDNGYYDLKNPRATAVKNRTNFNSIYQGGDIIFDPSLYSTDMNTHSSATFTADSLQIQFQELTEELKKYNFFTLVGCDYKKVENDFYNYFMKIENVQARYDSVFQDLFIHTQISLLRNFHPSKKEYNLLMKHRNPDLISFYQSDNYKEYLDLTVRCLKKANQLSSISSRFGYVCAELDYAVAKVPDLLSKHITVSEDSSEPEFGYFTDQILSWEDKEKDTKVSAQRLWGIANYYQSTKQKEKQKRILERLVAKYPQSWAVENRYVESMYNGIHLSPEAKVPDFHVETVFGDSLQFSKLQVPFIFLHFWSTKCGHSKREINFILDMKKNYSDKELLVIGLANDTPISLRECLTNNDIDFPNALAAPELLRSFGITAYPTTFLIGPDRTIIAKDLRGQHLPTLVKEEIDKYKQKSGYK